jgi:hypothetical protein
MDPKTPESSSYDEIAQSLEQQQPREREEHTFKVAPSTLGHYFDLSCDRFLAFRSYGIDNVLWFFQKKETDPNQSIWEPFQSEENIWIEIAYRCGEPTVHLPDNRILDINSKTLRTCVNIINNNNSIRDVRRGVWFYQIENDHAHRKTSWIPFREDDSKLLDTLYYEYSQLTKNTEKKTITLNDPKFPFHSVFVDFQSMTIREKDTDNTISISRGSSMLCPNKDPIVEAHLRSGEDWENVIVNEHLRQKGHFVITANSVSLLSSSSLLPSTPTPATATTTISRESELRLSQQKISYEQFIWILKNFTPPKDKSKNTRYFIYQPTFIVPLEFYRKFDICGTDIEFSTCYPDFIEIIFSEDRGCKGETLFKKELRIIDAKASPKIKMSHRIQVTTYALILEQILLHENLAFVTVSSHAGIWIRPNEDFDQFELRPLKSLLTRFFTEKLKTLSSKVTSLPEVEWHLTKKCTTCPYFHFCTAQAERANDLSLLRQITQPTKKFILDFLKKIESSSTLDKSYTQQRLKPKSDGSLIHFHSHSRHSTSPHYDIEDAYLLLKGFLPSAPQALMSQDSVSPVQTSTPSTKRTLNPTDPTVSPSQTKELHSFSSSNVLTPTRLQVRNSDPREENEESQTPPRSVSAAQEGFPTTPQTPKPQSFSTDSNTSSPLTKEPPKSPQTPLPSHVSPVGINEEILPRHRSHYLWLTEQKATKNTNSEENTKITFEHLPQAIRWELFHIFQKLSAWREKKPKPYNVASLTLNSAEDISLFITIQYDLPANRLFAWGILLVWHSNEINKENFLSQFDKVCQTIDKQTVKKMKLFKKNIFFAADILEDDVDSKHLAVAILKESFVRTLYAILTTIHQINQDMSDTLKESKSKFRRLAKLQCYVFDQNEYRNLQELIFEVCKWETDVHGRLNDNITACYALTLLLNFVDTPHVLLYKVQPDLDYGNSHLVHILKKIIDTLTALPLTFSADMNDFYNALAPDSDVSFDINTNDTSLNSRDILMSWYQLVKNAIRNKSDYEATVCRIKKRLLACNTILSSVRKLLTKSSKFYLLKTPHFFQLRPQLDFKQPLLSKLAYLIKYEQYIASEQNTHLKSSVLPMLIYHKHLIGDNVIVVKSVSRKNVLSSTSNVGSTNDDPLPSTPPAQTKSKAAHRTKSSKSDDPLSELPTFKIICFSENMRIEVDKQVETFDWLLTPVNQKGVCDLLKYNDFAYREAWSPPYGSTIAFARIVLVNDEEQTLKLSIKFPKGVERQFFDEEHYLLTPRHVDLLSQWVLYSLKEIELIYRFVPVVAELQSKDLQTTKWLKKLSLEMAETKDPALFNVPPKVWKIFSEFYSRLGFEKVPIKQLSNGPREEDDLNTTVALQPTKEYDDRKQLFRCIYLAIKEARGKFLTSKLFLDLLEDPISRWGRSEPEASESFDSASSQRALQLLDEMDTLHLRKRFFTASQCELFKQVLKKHLQLIWGPPGTGKTHFLGATIILLAEAHRTAQLSNTTTNNNNDDHKEFNKMNSNSESKNKTNSSSISEGKPFKVLVVAFTHAAIDHLICKVLEMSREYSKSKGDRQGFELPIARIIRRNAEEPQYPKEEGEVYPETLYAENALSILEWIDKNVQCVVAGTIWAVRKAFGKIFKSPRGFHLVVIDEASQMTLTDAYHPIRYLLLREGRLILAGDHEQLPPIINGDYPELPKSEPLLFSSVFHALKHKDVTEECTSMLLENWRMNEVLTELPATTIYKTSTSNAKFRCANKRVAQRTFPLKQLRKYSHSDSVDPNIFYFPKIEREQLRVTVRHPLLQMFLDGDMPFVVLLLKVDQHAEIGEFPQCHLISAFTVAARRCFNMNKPENESQFWAKRFHIVAPHHIQRHAIYNAIYSPEFNWNYIWDKMATPFIETVEKTQGQEVDCVIVDYGLLNSMQVRSELKFIYNRNRLNVAITRAKKKCLVVLSDVLTNGFDAVFQTKEMERGFAFIQDVLEFAKSKGTCYELPLSQISHTLYELQSDPFFTDIIISSSESSATTSRRNT